MIGIGIIGYGYWGPNLVRNFFETPDCRVVSVSDLSRDRLAKIGPRYPTVETTTDYRDLLRDPRIDAVVVATPVSTHFELGMEALRAGKHVLIEKPMTCDATEALRLVDEADVRKRILAVDHTFVYTPAVRKIHDLVTKGDLGDIYYYDSVRVNLGLFQHDVNVIWDLAVHDLAIMDYLLPVQPVAVSATGIGHVPGEPENMAYVTLHFDTNVMAHLHVNWLSPVKVRKTLIGGSRKMVSYDDLEPSEKIRIYDKGITAQGHRRRRRQRQRQIRDARRLPQRRPLGAADCPHRGVEHRSPSLRRLHLEQPDADRRRQVRPPRRPHARSRHRIDARIGPSH